MSSDSDTSNSSNFSDPDFDERGSKKRSFNTSEDEEKPSKHMKIDGIEAIFAQYHNLSKFCIGGKVEMTKNMSKLFYNSSNDTTHCIDFLNISKEEINTLINNCNKSTFGVENQIVIDPVIRQAKELKGEDFSFQFNPETKKDVNLQIKQFLGDREFVIQPQKLSICQEGVSFEHQKDTIKSEGVIASLVICLPIPFEGGILTVKNDKGLSANFDWGKEINESAAQNDIIQWVCFMPNCDIHISEIIKGKRVTFVYDVLAEDPKHYDLKNAVQDHYGSLCTENLQKYIKGLNVKKTYGYYPNHVYNFSDTEKEVKGVLKGNDLLLYETFKQCGWDTVLQVYYPEVELYGPHIEFCLDDDDDHSVDMEIAVDVLDEEEREKLNNISSLELLNKHCRHKERKIYTHVYVGYVGNSKRDIKQHYYATTVMVLCHKIKSEGNEGQK